MPRTHMHPLAFRTLLLGLMLGWATVVSAIEPAKPATGSSDADSKGKISGVTVSPDNWKSGVITVTVSGGGKCSMQVEAPGDASSPRKFKSAGFPVSFSYTPTFAYNGVQSVKTAAWQQQADGCFGAAEATLRIPPPSISSVGSDWSQTGKLRLIVEGADPLPGKSCELQGQLAFFVSSGLGEGSEVAAGSDSFVQPLSQFPVTITVNAGNSVRIAGNIAIKQTLGCMNGLAGSSNKNFSASRPAAVTRR